MVVGFEDESISSSVQNELESTSTTVVVLMEGDRTENPAQEHCRPPLSDPSQGDPTPENGATTDPKLDKPSLEDLIYYDCTKCRKRLLCETATVTHTMDTTKRSKVKVGDEGLCSAFVFVPFNVETQQFCVNVQSSPLTFQGEVVSCGGCKTKLGKLSFEYASCACGSMVPGPVGRLQSLKLDKIIVNSTSDAIQLDKMLKLDRIEVQLTEEESLLEAREKVGALKLSKKEKRMQKKDKSKHIAFFENRGQYSAFRDKSFKPNASKKVAQTQDTFDETDRPKQDKSKTHAKAESSSSESDDV